MHAAAGAQQRLDGQPVTQCGFQLHRFGDFGIQAADAHFKAGIAQNAGQRVNVLQIEGVAGVVFRHQQHRTGVVAGAIDGILRGDARQRDKVGIEIIKAAGKQVHIDRSHFVAGVADVHRAVKRRPVLLPFLAEPRFDAGLVLQQDLFEIFKAGGIFGGNRRQFHTDSSCGGKTITSGGIQAPQRRAALYTAHRAPQAPP